ncbi:MAG: ABC transporter substrate-binding protein [Candidatus Omnitrophota bacterium]
MNSIGHFEQKFNTLKFIKIAQIVVIMALLSAGLNLSQVKAEQKPIQKNKPYGGTLVWGTTNRPSIINPILTSHSVSAALLDIIFNRLVKLNTRGEMEPDLAESWEVSEDGLIYTFHLRRGVKFHDGVECTAEDVKFTYEAVCDPKVNSPYRSNFLLVDKWEVVDKYTFRIVLKKPYIPLLYKLVMCIAPKHLLESVDLANTEFNYHPIGTGPFKFKQWKEDDTIILEANDDYFEGRPYLDRIIIKTYPDSSKLWAALMRGEVDYMQFMEQKDYEIVKQDSTFKSYAIPVDYYFAVAYNLEDEILSDRRIRFAIAYSINRKELIQRVAAAYGIECLGPFYPESEFFYEGIKPFEYNPQKAQELLSEAGWQDIDKDGILEKDGDELELKILVDERSDIFKKIAMLIRQQLQEIGIKTNTILYNNESQLISEFLESKRPQMCLIYGFANRLVPDEAAKDWCSVFKIKAGRLWIYRNREVDRLFELGQITEDKEKRKKFYKKIHQLIYEDQPACFLYFPVHFHAISARFSGIDDFFSLDMPYYMIKDWYITDVKK